MEHDDVAGAAGKAEGGPGVPSAPYAGLPADLNSTGKVAGPGAKKKRVMWIGAAVLAVLIIIGGGSYQIYRLSQGSAPTGASAGPTRLSLPGASVAIPNGWQGVSLPATDHAAAAEPRLSPPCPQTVFGGAAACQDGLTIASVQGNSPRLALVQESQTRFTAMHHYIATATILRQGAAIFGSCPAYIREWHVKWLQPPDTIEERIVIRTGVRYADSNLESVFIRFADTSASLPQAAIAAIASSIQCKA
jgi:hypothetical protein